MRGKFHLHHAVAVRELVIILFLFGIGVWLFVPAMEKMQDQAALAEMKQTAIYIGRTVNTFWGALDTSERQSLALSEVLKMIADNGLQLSPNVSLVQAQLSPGGHLEFKHVRFPDRVFYFSYEGERLESLPEH